MKIVLLTLYIFSFLASSTSLACGVEKLSSHCDEKVSTSKNVEKESHSSNESDDDHSSDTCECLCHGHLCKSMSLASIDELSNLDADINSQIFDPISDQKIESYHSKIIRPPIS